MPRDNPTRSDTWQVRVQLDGGDIMEVWDKKTGGEVDSEETKYYPGGMLDPISLGGRKTVGNLVLQRLYDLKQDHDRISYLIAGAGKRGIGIGIQPMDIDGVLYGKTIHYDGILKRVTFPEVDSEASTAALLEIEVTINGLPTMI